MNEYDLPPIPPPGASGPQVCETVRLYLAVLNDVPAEQVERLLEHVRGCEVCAEELRLLQRSTEVVSRLGESAPSARVDSAILALTAESRTGANRASAGDVVAGLDSAFAPTGAQKFRDSGLSLPVSDGNGRVIPVGRRLFGRHRGKGRRPLRLIGALIAALIVLAMVPMVQFFTSSFGGNAGFSLPGNLSWRGYVVFHSQTKAGTDGMHYQIDCYHDLGSGRMHVETKMDESLDVIAVGDASEMLGMDMIHHVAQWGAHAWMVDDSMLNLATLRADLAAKRAVYLGKTSFEGQEVYRIQGSDRHVLLLDMQYRPVNMLERTSGGGAEQPMYDVFRLLPASQVSQAMWNMSVPPGFKMGTLPQRP